MSAKTLHTEFYRKTDHTMTWLGWLKSIFAGLRSGQKAQHDYGLLRARGVPSEDASRIVVNELAKEAA
jgi:hypothetical protein